MKRAFSILSRLLRIQLRSQLQYPTSFIMEVISSALTLGFYFVAFALAFTRFDEVGGWALGEIAFIWGLAEFSFGTMDMFFSGFDYDSFGPMVRRGRFDQLLLRPVNITLQVFGSRFILRRLGKMTEGLIIFFFGLTQIEIQWTALKILYLPVLTLSQILFFGSLFIIGATTTFWTMERLEVLNVFTYGGNEVMSYPIYIFQRPIRWIFTYLIPVALMSYFPAVFILDKPDPFNAPVFVSFLAPLVTAVMFFLAIQFWHFGIKNYQSTGS